MKGENNEYANGRLYVITELGLWVDENINNLNKRLEVEEGEQTKFILKGLLSGYKQFRSELNRKILRMDNKAKQITNNQTKLSMEIEIDGIVTVPKGVDLETFEDEFLEWIESKGYTFGGMTKAVKESLTPSQS